ncbi:hypothetical protein Mapa_000177 [Marchantia paleacea]|nr:hypothetical protein Mapa_000177 [Marchantia paleacea]
MKESCYRSDSLSGNELLERAHQGREKAIQAGRLGLHIRRKSLPGLQQTWMYGRAAVTTLGPLNRERRDTSI